ncbi:MAG: hypothetical protein DMF57_15595 [Acidobacteria bacterium]|nr:MAG: hypothetical protein DMF57_15595 [Acidobacteriota bacterium]
MKRAALGVLILSLVALPSLAGSAKARRSAVTAAHCVSLEHVPGGWRMEINCNQGKGVIVLSDAQDQKQYRGEGTFAGWSQQEMNDVYQPLIPSSESVPEIMQLG